MYTFLIPTHNERQKFSHVSHKHTQDSPKNYVFSHLKSVLNNSSGWNTYSQHIINCWYIVSLRNTAKVVKITIIIIHVDIITFGYSSHIFMYTGTYYLAESEI